MFRIGHFTGRIYNGDEVPLKDIKECCSLIPEELTEVKVKLEEVAADLHKRCANCRGIVCEEARKPRGTT